MTQSCSSGKFVKPDLDDDADRNAGAASALEPPNPYIPSDAAIEHFDVLLGAVSARLRLAVEDARAEAIATTPGEVLRRLRATVLECVEALEQLQATQRKARRLADGLEPPLA